MTDKERLEHYLSRLEDWEKSLAAFFESECPTASPVAVRLLLAAHSDILNDLVCTTAELPELQDK